MNPASFCIRFLRIVLGVSCLATFAVAQSPNPSSRIVQAIDETSRIPLAGTTPQAIKGGQDLGAVESNHSLQHMVLLLTPGPGQAASLKSLIESQHNKGSANYHKWLTPEQFAAQFGPSDDDLATVKGWLQTRGLNPTAAGRGRQWVEFSGSVQQVNSAFATSMHRFNLNGETHIANSSDISIPRALAPVVAGVLSLNDFRKQPAHSKLVLMKRNTEGKAVPVNPEFTSTDGNGNYFYNLAPGDFQAIYNEAPLLTSGVNGTGISIAIAGRSDISLGDVQEFRQLFGLPQNDPNIILTGTDPGFPNVGRDQVESTLDVEWSMAAAPGATVNLVESTSSDTTDGIDLSSAYIVDNAISPILSVSYGTCEALMGPYENAFYNSLWEQAAAEGITVFVATGDGGAAQCDVDLQNANLEPQGPALNGPTINGLASTPFNVSVGGTQLNEANNYGAYWAPNNGAGFQSVLGYIPEQAWNESCDPTLPQTGTNCYYGQTSYVLVGGGGGPSNCSQASIDSQGNETCIAGYPKPSWQTGTGVPADGVRDIPDLSLNASPDDDGYLICVNGSCQTETLNGQTELVQWGSIGGTSASTPAMAGIMALVEQKNGAFQGQANYVFYRLAAMDSASSCNSSTMLDPTLSTSCNINDITMGNNSDPGLAGYGTSTAEWSAGTGYDMATGLGTINAANLVANWGSVSVAGSTATLTADGASAAHGQPLTIHIHVAAASGNSIPTGDVALVTDKYGSIGDITLDASGNFSGPVTNLPGGTFNLTARYGGDGTFGSSISAPVSLTVAPEPSATSVSLEVVDPSTNRYIPNTGTLQYGYPLFISARVAGKSGQGIPTGTMNVLNGSSVIMSAPLTSDGSAFFSTGGYPATYDLPVGTSTISVQYLGDNSFGSSTSAPQQVTVQKQQVSLYTGVATDDATAGQPVFLSATIDLGFGIQLPTGTFQFYDNGQPLGGPVAVVNNHAGGAYGSYAAQFTTVGMHTITGGYSGDANYAAVSGTDPNANSQSLQIYQASGAATATSIVQTPTSPLFGQYVTYAVKVTPVKPGGPAPTGAVYIESSDGEGGFILLNNGLGSTTGQMTARNAQVFASYQGDANYARSSSPMITTTVQKFTPPASFTTTAPYVLSGQQTSLNMVVTGYSYGQYGVAAPSGSVQFLSSLNGGPQQAITPAMTLLFTQSPINAGVSVRVTLPTGSNMVTAVYSGDQYFNGVTSAPVTVVVSSPDFTVSSDPSSLTISAGGSTTDALAVTPILGFTGAVSLSCGSGLPAGTTCSFSPSAVPGGGGQSNLTIAMQGPFTARASNKKAEWVTVSELCGLVGLFFVGFAASRKKVSAMLLAIMAIAAFGFLSGCGGSAGPTSTVVVLDSSQSKVASGTAVTFTAEVTGGNNAPGGTITFYDGTTALGNAVALTNGQATQSVSSLTVGTHSITAKYSGDSSHDGSASQAFYEAVTGVANLEVVASSGGLSHTLAINVVVQ